MVKVVKIVITVMLMLCFFVGVQGCWESDYGCPIPPTYPYPLTCEYTQAEMDCWPCQCADDGCGGLICILHP